MIVRCITVLVTLTLFGVRLMLTTITLLLMGEVLIFVTDVATLIFIHRRCGVCILVCIRLRHRHKCLDHSMVQLVCLVTWLALEEARLHGTGIEKHLTFVVVPNRQATLLRAESAR